MKKPILILGVNGFCGTELARQLFASGEPFVGVDIGPVASPRIGSSFSYRQLDLLENKDAFARLVGEIFPCAIYNFVRPASPEASPEELEPRAAEVVLDALVELGLKDTPTLFLGSAAEYGPADPARLPLTEEAPTRPINPYGRGKLAQTQLVLAYAGKHGLRVNVARPFNMIGLGMPANLFIPEFLAQCAINTKIEVRNLDATRDFIDVTDAVKQFRRIVASSARGEIFNVCTGREVPIREVVNYYVGKLTRPVSLAEIPSPQPEIQRSAGSNRKVMGLPGPTMKLTDLFATLDAIYAERAG